MQASRTQSTILECDGKCLSYEHRLSSICDLVLALWVDGTFADTTNCVVECVLGPAMKYLYVLYS